MDLFRKAHCATSLKSKLPKVTNTKMRLKLKKLLYDFSKNDLDSIRKETLKEYSDETLNDSSLDCVQDVDDLSNNVDYDSGQAEDKEVDCQHNVSLKKDRDDCSDDIPVNSGMGEYVTESQSNHRSNFLFRNPQMTSTEDEPPGLHQKNTKQSNGDLCDHSDKLDSSNNESIVSSEEMSDLDEQSLFDISGGLAFAIKENMAFSQELHQTEKLSDYDSLSSNEFPTNQNFSINSQINPEFMDTLNGRFDSTHSDSSRDSVGNEIFTAMVCDRNENSNEIEEMFTDYVCRIGNIEPNCTQYIPDNVTNMFKVKNNISKNFEVFIPTFDVPLETPDSEDRPDITIRAKTVATDLDDTVAESSCADFDDTRATRNVDDTMDESCYTNLNDTVDTYNPHTPQNHSHESDSVRKANGEPDTVDYGVKHCHNEVQVHVVKNGCVVIIKYPSCMYIDGKVIVRSLCGHIEIFGYKLNENPVNVFSPRYNYSMRLKTFPNEGDTYGLFGKLTNLGMSVAKTEDIVTSLSVHDAVLFMEPLKEHMSPFIENHWSLATKTSDKAYSKQHPDLFSKTKSYYDEEFSEASQTLVDCSLYANKPTKQLQENPLWDSLVLLGQAKNSIALIAGGKNVGKSTLLRYYVNKLLPQGPVTVVDLDPGQSEFTISGNISITVVKAPLLGPNFTHLQTPNLMLNLGLINVMDNFEKYTRAVHQIANHLQNNVEYHDMPWVINTMGFTTSIGLKLIAYTILLLKPTVVAQLEAASDKHNFHINLSMSKIAHVLDGFDKEELFDFLNLKDLMKDKHNLDYELIQIQHDVKKQYKFSQAKQQRYLNVLGYFSQVLHSSNSFLLNGAKPFFVSQANIKFGFNVPVHEDMIFHILNAKIVALCNDDKEEHRLGEAFLMGDCAYVCYGHGIVRGVDIERKLLYLITPVDFSALHHVNALLYAEHTPELQLARSELPGGARVPYREPVASPRHARLMAAPRRRFNPMRLLRPKPLFHLPSQ